MNSTCRPFPRERPARCFTTAPPAETLFALAEQLFAQRRIEAAVKNYEEAIRLGGDPAASAFQRWMCYMLLGRFEAAWRETDRCESARRAASITTADLPRHMQRVWNGEPLAGRRVLVRCYHGLGDTIQFIRYIPILRETASVVFVQCQESLIPLLRSIPIEHLMALDQSLPESEYDVAIELMELPYAFRTTFETVPSTVPYLHVPSSFVKASLIPPANGAIRVGLVWSSGTWNPERNIHFPQLRPLARVPGVAFFSLQRGPAQEEVSGCHGELPVLPGESSSGGILETAGALANLDLVISADTMAAHLAGALGRPVWTLLPFAGDWRWMLDREDSPWYPTMRLFRQPSPGDWASVVECVAAELGHRPQAHPERTTP